MVKLPYFSHEPPVTWKDANRIAAVKMSMQGFPVFPCFSQGIDPKDGKPLAKRPIGQWKHWKPRAWQEIDEHWRGNWAEYLPGIGLAAHRHLIIDPDVKGGIDGLGAWNELVAEYGLPEGVPETFTPSGGKHLWFRQQDGLELGNSPGTLPRGIDVRGIGGLVIAPGAMLPDGSQWTYAEGTIFRAAPFIPEWLLTFLQGATSAAIAKPPAYREPVNLNIIPFGGAPGEGGSRYYRTAFLSELDTLRSARPGERNNQLNKSAFAIGGLVCLGGVDRNEAINALADIAGELGLMAEDGTKQVFQTIMSGIAAAERKPRAAPEIKTAMPRLELPAGLRAAKRLTPAQATPDPVPAAVEPSELTAETVENALRWMFRREVVELERVPIIKRVIPRRGTGILAGPSRAGKSFLAVDLCIAASSGQDWFGTWPVRDRVGVAYIAGEASGKIEDRFDAAEAARGITSRLPIMIAKRPENLMDEKNRMSLLQDLCIMDDRMMSIWGVRVGLVIIDTLSACFWMKNENDAPEAAYVCRIMDQIAECVDGFCLTLHHTAKDAIVGGRGSGAFFANVDQFFNAVALRDELDQLKGRSLYLGKNREGDEISFGEFHIEGYEIRKDMDGDPVAPGTVKIGKAPHNSSSPKKENIALKAICDAYEACMETCSFPFLKAEGGVVNVVLVESVKDRFVNFYPSRKNLFPDTLRKQRKAGLDAWDGCRGVTLDGEDIIWRE